MPNLGAFAVRQWQFTLVVFGLLAVLGLNSLISIPRAEDPHFPIPVVAIRAILPGAEPLDVERLVADPIEDALSALHDVQEIESTSIDGVAIVIVEFEWTVDDDRKYDEVVREINALRPQLPSTLAEIVVERIRTTRTNIVQAALVSETADWRELEARADEITDILDRTDGVWEAEFWGVPALEIRIAVDLGRLAALGIPITRVADALSNEGLDVPPGAVHAGGRRFNVKATGSFDTLDEIRSVVVAQAGGRTLTVGDVAEIGWAVDEAEHLTRFNGERAVFVTATQKDGENVFLVRDGIFAALEAFEATLPPTIRLERGFDQSSRVSERLGNLTRDFAIALAIVLVTLLPLGLRASLVVMISIPLSLAIGVTLLSWTGFSLNQLSIAGAVLALGLLVDDSIVVTENIERHLRMGFSRREAAIRGTGQISLAVLGCTATLMLAFLPLLFIPEGGGRYTRSLPVTVFFTVGASLLVALTIIPFLASRFLAEHEDPRGNLALRVVMGGIHAFYRPLLHQALLRPRMTVGLAGVLFALSLPLVSVLGFSLFPASDSPTFLIEIETPDGTALENTDRALRAVEALLAENEEVDWYMSNLGRGNPQVFYNVRQRERSSSYAEVFVKLHEWSNSRSPAVLDAMRAQFTAIPGTQIVIRVFENGPPLDAPIAVRIAGPELAILKYLAAQAADIVRATPGTRDVVNPVRLDRTDLDLGIDTGKAALLGVPAGIIDRTLRLALEGETVARFRDTDGDDYPVQLRLPLGERHDLDVFSRIFVPTQTGESLPLSLITSPALAAGPSRIDRFDRERTVTVTAYVDTGAVNSKVSADVAAALGALEMPSGYRLSFGGQAEATARSLGGLGNAAIIALFGIIAVLILEFRSYSATAVVAGVIPLGIIGGLVALFLTGYSLSFTAIVGFIALIGIEIKNSILLVDFTSQLRRQGVPLREAIEQAGEIRFLPVLLTSVTAIGGLMPLALENSGLYSPLSIVIIGGLISSTLLSRLVTPAMYLLLAPRELEDDMDDLAAPAVG